MRRLATVLILLMATAFCAQAFAGKKDEAKKHFKAGLALLKAEDFDAAAVEFEESIELYKTTGAMFNLANCYKAMHRYADALGKLKSLENEFEGSIKREMSEAIDTLKAEIESITGTIDVKVNRNGAEISVDGVSVGTSPLASPVMLGPGHHELTVVLDGMKTYSKKVKLISREQVAVEVNLRPGSEGPQVSLAEDPEENGPEPATIPGSEGDGGRSPALLGLSIAGTAVTVGLGVVAGVFWSKKNEAADDYDNNLELYSELDPASTSYEYSEEEERIFGELEDARDDVDKNNKMMVGMTVGAGVMAAASIVLWVLWARSDGDEELPASVEIAPAPGGVAVNF